MQSSRTQKPLHTKKSPFFMCKNFFFFSFSFHGYFLGSYELLIEFIENHQVPNLFFKCWESSNKSCFHSLIGSVHNYLSLRILQHVLWKSWCQGVQHSPWLSVCWGQLALEWQRSQGWPQLHGRRRVSNKQVILRHWVHEVQNDPKFLKFIPGGSR